MREEYVLKRVTQLLKERSWTLYRLAKEGEISYSTLSNSFQRNNVPSVSTLIRICEGFGITMAEFFDEGGTMPKQLTVSDQQLITDFHRLPRNDKNLVTAYMQGLLKVASAQDEEEQEQGQAPDQDEAQSSDENPDENQKDSPDENPDESQKDSPDENRFENQEEEDGHNQERDQEQADE